MSADGELLQRFVAFSAEVTGFRAVELWGTGQAEAYLATVRAAAGEPALRELLDSSAASGAAPGPLAGSIAKLWYAGTWYPPGERAGAPFVVSPAAYTEGLMWRAIGAHPAGAKAPGYGSWAKPPAFGESAR